ncbi:MAG: DUF4232 domain-containing protein [Gaiellaceae bacterium]|jgi:hypothetical protein
MRSPKRLILLGTALLAVAATVSVTQVALGSRPAKPRCAGSQLKGKLLDSNGAAGTILFSVTLQNKGSACTLNGYPALGIANAKGLLPTNVVHGGLPAQSPAPKLVNLAHLGKASVLISFEDVPVGGETSCPTGNAIVLRPPGAWEWLTIKAGTQACEKGTLHTSPVLAGVHSSQ